MTRAFHLALKHRQRINITND